MTRGQHDVISVFANIADALLADLPTFLFRCSCCRFIVGYVALNYVGQYQQQNNKCMAVVTKCSLLQREKQKKKKERESG